MAPAITLRLPTALHVAVRTKANDDSVSMNQWIVRACEAYLARDEREQFAELAERVKLLEQRLAEFETGSN